MLVARTREVSGFIWGEWQLVTGRQVCGTEIQWKLYSVNVKSIMDWGSMHCLLQGAMDQMFILHSLKLVFNYAFFYCEGEDIFLGVGNNITMNYNYNTSNSPLQLPFCTFASL